MERAIAQYLTENLTQASMLDERRQYGPLITWRLLTVAIEVLSQIGGDLAAADDPIADLEVPAALQSLFDRAVKDLSTKSDDARGAIRQLDERVGVLIEELLGSNPPTSGEVVGACLAQALNGQELGLLMFAALHSGLPGIPVGTVQYGLASSMLHNTDYISNYACAIGLSTLRGGDDEVRGDAERLIANLGNHETYRGRWQRADELRALIRTELLCQLSLALHLERLDKGRTPPG